MKDEREMAVESSLTICRFRKMRVSHNDHVRIAENTTMELEWQGTPISPQFLLFWPRARDYIVERNERL